MADDQSTERNAFPGARTIKDCPALNAEQWKHVGKIVADAEKSRERIRTGPRVPSSRRDVCRNPEEVETFFDATSHTNIGLCLDTGHCVYGLGDSVKEARNTKTNLRFVHIKDCDAKVLAEARRNKWTFEEAIEHKVFTMIGKGNIDFPAFFRTLAEEWLFGLVRGGAGRKFGDTTVPPAESVAASLNFLRGVVAELDMVNVSPELEDAAPCQVLKGRDAKTGSRSSRSRRNGATPRRKSAAARA